MARLVKGFGRFWWDFLVGDTPELFVAALMIIGATAVLSEAGRFNDAAIVVLPCSRSWPSARRWCAPMRRSRGK